MTKAYVLKSRVKGDFHARFGIGGGAGDCPTDHNDLCQELGQRHRTRQRIMLIRISEGMNVPATGVVCSKGSSALTDQCICCRACTLVVKGVNEPAYDNIDAQTDGSSGQATDDGNATNGRSRCRSKDLLLEFAQSHGRLSSICRSRSSSVTVASHSQ